MEKKKTLLLFSLSFPYSLGGENSFLHSEIESLKKRFDSVIIFPSKVGGYKQELSKSISINESFAHFCKNSKGTKLKKIIFSLTTALFFKEIIFRFRIIANPKKLYDLISYIYNSHIVKKWLLSFLEHEHYISENVIFYTYWFNHITTGIGLVKKIYPNLKVVTRAHGLDLYEYRNNNYLPCRNQSIKLLDRIYLISKDGKKYIDQKYSGTSLKSKVNYLGVIDPHFCTKSSSDGILRIVSCSSLIPIKRVDLIVDALQVFLNINIKVHWTHIGGGKLYATILQRAKMDLPQNVSYTFLGKLNNEEVYQFYKNNPVDLFINVSITEGLPVTLMEAQSCGIPVVATNVGGNAEIVNDNVGVLLSANPNPEEIAELIVSLFNNPSLLIEMRKNSKKNWENNFNADKNYKMFADDLMSIIN